MTRKQNISTRDSIVMVAVIGLLALSVWVWKQTGSETLPLAGLGLICLIVAADNFYTLTHGGKDQKTQRRLTTMGVGALIVLMAILFVLFKTILGR